MNISDRKCPNCKVNLYFHLIHLQCPSCSYNESPNVKVLDALYSWVSIDREGREGLFAVTLENGVMMTALSSDLDMCKRISKFVPKLDGFNFKILEFKRVGFVEE